MTLKELKEIHDYIEETAPQILPFVDTSHFVDDCATTLRNVNTRLANSECSEELIEIWDNLLKDGLIQRYKKINWCKAKKEVFSILSKGDILLGLSENKTSFGVEYADTTYFTQVEEINDKEFEQIAEVLNLIIKQWS